MIRTDPYQMVEPAAEYFRYLFTIPCEMSCVNIIYLRVFHHYSTITVAVNDVILHKKGRVTS